MNLIEKLLCYPSFSLLRFLVIITIIQFWWIAVWGLAYIAISSFAGTSKVLEVLIYIGLMLAVILAVQIDPSLIQKL
jgi:hypothetical protein